MKMKWFAARSKKSGRFFKFKEYSTDGWGKYEDSISKDFYKTCPTEVPSFWSEEELGHFLRNKVWNGYGFKYHTLDEVEFVSFQFSTDFQDNDYKDCQY